MTDDRAVRLALQAAAHRTRADRAETTLARIQALARQWQAEGNPAAEQLQRALNG